MDSTQFDELTKALATATSRRQALKTIAATTLGGLLGLGSIDTAFGKKPPCHRNGTGCDTDSQCCSGLCQNGKCVPCIANGGTCTQGSDCCSGLCDRISTTCVSCIPYGDFGCSGDSDCCPGLVCNSAVNQCFSCGPSGFFCKRDADCCSNSCNFLLASCN